MLVPPDGIFGVIPTWLGVYTLSLVMFGFVTLILYRRVFALILLGQRVDRFDQPFRRIKVEISFDNAPQAKINILFEVSRRFAHLFL